jgi:hypothetical protein
LERLGRVKKGEKVRVKAELTLASDAIALAGLGGVPEVLVLTDFIFPPMTSNASGFFLSECQVELIDDE